MLYILKIIKSELGFEEFCLWHSTSVHGEVPTHQGDELVSSQNLTSETWLIFLS